MSDIPSNDLSTRAAVAVLLRSGHSRVETATVLGLSLPTISYHAGRLGYPAETKFARRYDWAEVQRYYDSGHTINHCIAHFGMARASITEAVRRGALVTRPRAIPPESLFVAGRLRNRLNLKRRLIAHGLKEERCEECGIAEWRGRPLSLALHHVNGDGRDNRLENLRLLCPNCHSQTENFAARGAALRRRAA